MAHSQPHTEDIISSLSAITRELTDLIRQEMTLLKEKRPAEISLLNDAKSTLMANYSTRMEELKRNGGFKAAGTGDVVRQFKKENEIFRTVLKEHKSMLYALKTVSERMIKAIGEEVALQTSQSRGYGANAQMQHAKSNKVPTTLALNKTI